MVHKIRRMYLC